MNYDNSNYTMTGIEGSTATKGIPGWTQGQTEVGGNLKIRLGHVQGVQSLDHNTISIGEPFKIGRFIGFWLRKPPFLNPIVADFFDYFLQDRILEVSGLADNQIGVLERQTGPVGRSEAFAGNYKENNAKFTIKTNEVKGSPVRKLMRYYITAMSDSQTGQSHFHDATGNLRFVKLNYSGDFIYILLGPSMKPEDIEFACAWFYAFPSVDMLGHLNSGAIGADGDAANEKEIEFNGIYVHNSKIVELGKIIAESFGYYKDTNEDVILPSYLDSKYFNSEAAQNLSSEIGVDMNSKLTRALSSDAQGDVDASKVVSATTVG